LEACPEINGGYDLPAEVDQTANRGIRRWYGGNNPIPEHLLDPHHLDTEKELADEKGAELARHHHSRARDWSLGR
jgi:hypothetical protein